MHQRSSQHTAYMTTPPSVTSQWVHSIVSYSTQYGSDSYSASCIIGPPAAWPSTATPKSWCPTRIGQQEFLELAFESPVVPTELHVYGSFLVCAIVKMSVRKSANDEWSSVWEREEGTLNTKVNKQYFSLSHTQEITQVRVDMDNSEHKDWPYVDSVQLVGKTSNYTIDVNCASFALIAAQNRVEAITRELDDVQKEVQALQIEKQRMQEENRALEKRVSSEVEILFVDEQWPNGIRPFDLDYNRNQIGVPTKTLRALLQQSLANEKWGSSQQAQRTRSWFEKWIENLTAEEKELFLQMITGQSALPAEISAWHLTVLPRDKDIAIHVASRRMEIGVDQNEEGFQRMMDRALHQR